MTQKEIIDIARALPFCSTSWAELYAAADEDTTEEIRHLEVLAYHREEIAADMY